MHLTGLEVAVYGFKNEKRIEPAGISYELCIVRDLITLGRSTEPVLRMARTTVNNSILSNGSTASLNSSAGNDQAILDFLDLSEESYLKYLKCLDPTDFKNQDHYKVLGLSSLRWKASAAQIRAAYRAILLKYHPDKCDRKATVEKLDEDYFTCITKAYEQLGISEQKRRAYDSVDPEFDDSIPDEKDLNDHNFFEILTPVFERNERWSNIQPVPRLGDNNSSVEDVSCFYTFWFKLDSWREFSYLDEEDKEKGEDRYERREIEKFNRVEREKRRKNELKRIRSLVEMAYRKDPRVAIFKEQERIKKKNEKLKRQRIANERRAEEEKKKLEIELQNRKEIEMRIEKEKMIQAQEKKIREQQKKQLIEARKSLRQLVQDKNYWDSDGSAKLNCMEAVERICLLTDSKKITDVACKLEELKIYKEAMNVLTADYLTKTEPVLGSRNGNTTSTKETATYWTPEEISLVVKATNLYPAGTVNRWLEIANYVNEHRPNKGSKSKTDKDVIQQVKALKTLSVRTPQTKYDITASKKDDAEWTNDEQKLLEAALKKFPTSDQERWDKIADYVGRSKKDCIKRFKYLVEMVKNKKMQAS